MVHGQARVKHHSNVLRLITERNTLTADLETRKVRSGLELRAQKQNDSLVLIEFQQVRCEPSSDLRDTGFKVGPRVSDKGGTGAFWGFHHHVYLTVISIEVILHIVTIKYIL